LVKSDFKAFDNRFQRHRQLLQFFGAQLNSRRALPLWRFNIPVIVGAKDEQCQKGKQSNAQNGGKQGGGITAKTRQPEYRQVLLPNLALIFL
jgi:hypothetical protein